MKFGRNLIERIALAGSMLVPIAEADLSLPKSDSGLVASIEEIVFPQTKKPFFRVSFEEARESSRLRANYLSVVISENPPPMNVQIIYNDAVEGVLNPANNSLRQVIRTGAVILPRSNKLERLTTEIYSGAFKEAETESEFLSGLVDHEYSHLFIFSGKLSIKVNQKVLPELQRRVFDVNGDMFDCFQELFAYYSQINAFQKRELGDKYKLEIIKAYQEYRRMIERKEHTPAVEWMLFRFPEIK